MANIDGFECCLGQCSRQDGIDRLDLVNQADPEDVARSHREEWVLLSNFVENDLGTLENNNLSERAIEINDSEFMPIPKKMTSLRELFKENGLKIKFKNIKKALARKEKFGY